MKKAELGLGIDYSTSTFGSATATGWFSMLDGNVSPYHVVFFYEKDYVHPPVDLCSEVKSTVRQIERDDGYAFLMMPSRERHARMKMR